LKIGLQTWGSDGDLNPFFALAGGLAAAGHDITLAITSGERKYYGPFGERLGFRLIQVGYLGTDDDLLEVRRKVYETANPFKQVDFVLKLFESGVDCMYEAARLLCAESDLVIGHCFLYPLQAAAEKAGMPYVTVTLNHGCLPTRFAPPAGFPNLGGCFNRMLWKIGIKKLNGYVLPAINRLRLKEGLPLTSSYRETWESPFCNLIAVSPEICTPMPDWQPSQHVCGFLRLADAARPWSIPDSLAQFLAAGPPPVYMTFGSMLSLESDTKLITETTHLLVEAARAAHCRAIIQSRWEEVSDIQEYPEIYRIGEAPHTTIFPHCPLVVHHGGAGTTQTATLCGCPSVVVAHYGDQYFWGRELKRLGVAPIFLERRTVTPEKLGREIRRVLNAPAMSERAKNLGTAIHAEDGVTNAVAIIERLMRVLENHREKPQTI